MTRKAAVVVSLFLLILARPVAQAPGWVARSNDNAQILLKVMAKYSPEGAARVGVQGLDEQVTQLGADRRERTKADMRAAAFGNQRVERID